jgi:hypothetical protein
VPTRDALNLLLFNNNTCKPSVFVLLNDWNSAANELEQYSLVQQSTCMYSYKRKMDSPAHFGARVVDPFSGVQARSQSATSVTSSQTSTVQLVILALIWYSCAVVTITTSKELMIRAQLPYMLCFCQFFFASVLSYAYLYTMKQMKGVPSEAQSRVLQISGTYTAGFVLTNIAFSLGKPFIVLASPLV